MKLPPTEDILIYGYCIFGIVLFTGWGVMLWYITHR